MVVSVKIAFMNPNPTKQEERVPNPGTKEAIEKGCKCPVIDNHYGKGILINGEPSFWYTESCELHNE